MNIKIIKTAGIYFRQYDARKEGYYTTDDEGNLEKNEYKITIKDKLKFLAFNKKPFEPISTSYLSFRFYDNKLIVISGYLVGDAISVAKEVKKSSSYAKKKPYEILESSIVIDYGNTKQELEFDSEGKNTSCKLITNEPFKIESKQVYSYINWDEI